MGLFASKGEKQEKQNDKLRAKLQKHGLENIDAEYLQDCVDIYTNLMGVGMIEFGSTLSGMKSEEKVKTAYLHAIMDQNWIMIKQLDKISKLLDK